MKTYLLGIAVVFLQVCAMAVLVMWGLQILALAHGETYDWGAVLQHLILTFSFVVFFPGQTIWTYRMRDPAGNWITIIGREVEEDSGRE